MISGALPKIPFAPVMLLDGLFTQTPE